VVALASASVQTFVWLSDNLNKRSTMTAIFNAAC
jgi:hypothetical protein